MNRPRHQSPSLRSGSGTGQACSNCGEEFTLDQTDLDYLERVSPEIAGRKYLVPPPTHCPACRMQRRFTWRNERFLYHRKCDLSGKGIISNIAPDKDLQVYEQQEWWGDTWDPRSCGIPYDFNRPFFEQFAELQQCVPQLCLNIWNCQNCEYCNYAGDDKDCYLIFGSVYSEDCYYGSPYYSKDCVDTLVVRECEQCYECVDSRKLHTCFYCQDCHSSNNLIYCYDCQGCTECIGCAGLRNKKFCIFNEELSESEYEKKKAELDLCIPEVQTILMQKLEELSLSIPHRYMQSNQVENVSGNYVYQCKSVHDSYYTDRSEDCKYCAQVVDMKDCYDNNYCEENELCYEYFGGYINHHLLFSKVCQCRDSIYVDACHASHHLFGCISMRNAEYCILNKQYSKEEWEDLVPKIIEHMQTTGEWGEFFPIHLSPFGYNESVAQEYFPMTKEEVLKKGWNWYEEEESQDKYMGPEQNIPKNIDEVDDSIVEKILQCEETGKLFRLIPRELAFYKEHHLPIPKYCPNERHRRRLAKRNPRKLFDRTCDKCNKEIRTTYAPDRPEIVYCDECYLATIY